MKEENPLSPKQVFEFYRDFGFKKEDVVSFNDALKLPVGRLTQLARERRTEALNEALAWKSGSGQEARVTTYLYHFKEYSIAVAKPGKEAAPDYKGCRHYVTQEKTNNPNDMLPLILKNKERFEKNLSFGEIFERIEHLMRSDLISLDIMGTLLFRAAFMLDHKKNEKGNWRYAPPEVAMDFLEKRLPKVSGIPVRAFLHFIEVLSLNEDVKVYTLGYKDFKQDYGRINTLLTFSHLIAVLLNRTSISKFAGSFARPPSGMAPLPKTKAHEYFYLLSRELNQQNL